MLCVSSRQVVATVFKCAEADGHEIAEQLAKLQVQLLLVRFQSHALVTRLCIATQGRSVTSHRTCRRLQQLMHPNMGGVARRIATALESNFQYQRLTPGSIPPSVMGRSVHPDHGKGMHTKSIGKVLVERLLSCSYSATDQTGYFD